MKVLTDIKKWASLGKPVVILSLIGLLLYAMVLGIIDRRNMIKAKVEQSRAQAQIVLPEIPMPGTLNGNWVKVKAGEWSDWLPAMDVSLSIAPEGAMVIYERKDPDQRVVTKRGKPNKYIEWNDTATEQRIKSDVDLIYKLKPLQ